MFQYQPTSRGIQKVFFYRATGIQTLSKPLTLDLILWAALLSNRFCEVGGLRQAMNIRMKATLELLEMLKYEHLCLSCWSEILYDYLDKKLGNCTRQVLSIVVSVFPFCQKQTKRNLRKDVAPLKMICKDCKCDEISYQEYRAATRAARKRKGSMLPASEPVPPPKK